MSRRILMSDESQAFLRHIARASLDDNEEEVAVAKAVYADWLEERGLPSIAHVVRTSHYARYPGHVAATGSPHLSLFRAKSTVNKKSNSVEGSSYFHLPLAESLHDPRKPESVTFAIDGEIDPEGLGREGMAFHTFKASHAGVGIKRFEQLNRRALAEHDAREAASG